MSTIQINLPESLLAEAKKFIEEGWGADFDALVAESLRRYLESHRPELIEAFIREDVAWGLHGRG
jgi:metal-responsive CopG/Arc/MetJ family transcriptional regulator